MMGKYLEETFVFQFFQEYSQLSKAFTPHGPSVREQLKTDEFLLPYPKPTRFCCLRVHHSAAGLNKTVDVKKIRARVHTTDYLRRYCNVLFSTDDLECGSKCFLVLQLSDSQQKSLLTVWYSTVVY